MENSVLNKCLQNKIQIDRYLIYYLSKCTIDCILWNTPCKIQIGNKLYWPAVVMLFFSSNSCVCTNIVGSEKMWGIGLCFDPLDHPLCRTESAVEKSIHRKPSAAALLVPELDVSPSTSTWEKKWAENGKKWRRVRVMTGSQDKGCIVIIYLRWAEQQQYCNASYGNLQLKTKLYNQNPFYEAKCWFSRGHFISLEHCNTSANPKIFNH